MNERPSVDECRAMLASAVGPGLVRLIAHMRKDPRKGVADAVEAASRRLARSRAETKRLVALTAMEQALHERGVAVVAGVDEVGRGSLAGPLTACAVVLPLDARIPGLDDSKRLPPEKRERVAAGVRESATAWCVAHAEASEIDSLGMTAATRLAMRRALDGLGLELGHVLVDGTDAHVGWPATAVIDGDAKVAAIAAASVVAKVTRDAIMVGLEVLHPGYGFAVNKGYGTAEHVAAIRELGPSAVHRRSFGPCADNLSLF